MNYESTKQNKRGKKSTEKVVQRKFVVLKKNGIKNLIVCRRSNKNCNAFNVDQACIVERSFINILFFWAFFFLN